MGGAELPIDLLIEILHRLPAKSLLRFQSVSKSWPPLIRDPNFIARHLRLASESKSSTTILQFEQAKVHLSRMDTPHSLQSFSCNRDFTVIGSSNGLICLLYQSCRVIISNMLIKDHHMTPIPSILFDSKSCDARRSSDVLGFGYDSVSDDYKVVLMKFKYNGYEPKCVGTAIYSIRSDVWSKGKQWDVIGERVGVPSFMNSCSRGVVVSCGLHWLGHARARDNESLILLIVGFHLNREEIFELPLPDQLSKSRGGLDFHIRMGVLSNCLCISNVIGEQPYNDIWVMKEYGVHASWTKLFRFEPKLEGSIFTIVNPLIHFPKEDQVLLYEEIHQLFFLYDIRDRQERRCIRNYAMPDFYSHMCPVEAVCSSTIVSLADYRAHWSLNETLRKKGKVDDYSSDCLKAFDDFHHQFNLFLGMSRNL